MPVREPKRRKSELPEWPDPFVEPERPKVQILEDVCPDGLDINLELQDPVAAEWLAYYLTTRIFWSDFGNWLDSHR